jgi:hypothetical protein
MRWTTFACFIAHRHEETSRSPDPVTAGRIIMTNAIRARMSAAMRTGTRRVGPPASSPSRPAFPTAVNWSAASCSPRSEAASLTVRIDPTKLTGRVPLNSSDEVLGTTWNSTRSHSCACELPAGARSAASRKAKYSITVLDERPGGGADSSSGSSRRLFCRIGVIGLLCRCAKTAAY